MGASARMRIDDTSRGAARSAAYWLPGFYPQVAVTLEENLIELRSEAYDTASLKAIWAAALANELLLARGSAQRVAAFSALAT